MEKITKYIERNIRDFKLIERYATFLDLKTQYYKYRNMLIVPKLICKLM